MCGLGYVTPGYMCILLYVKPIHCTGDSIDPCLILGDGGMYVLDIFVYYSICKTYSGVVVFHRSIVARWNGVGVMSTPWYICILLYHKTYSGLVVFHISIGQLERGYDMSWVYVHSSINKTYSGVVVFHRSIGRRWNGVGVMSTPGYMCILLYLKLILV